MILLVLLLLLLEAVFILIACAIDEWMSVQSCLAHAQHTVQSIDMIFQFDLI